MVRCLVGLGSNLGQSQLILDQAVEFLRANATVLSTSRWYRFPSIGPSADAYQPDFLNGVVLLDSPHSAPATAELLHTMERAAGRERTTRWSSRTLDADLLLFGNEIIQTESLTVPHPRMMSRRFVLEPAAEVAHSMRHPVIGWTMQRLLQHLVEATPLFVVLSDNHQVASSLTQRLAEATHGRSYLLNHASTSSAGPPGAVKSLNQTLNLLSKEVSAEQAGPWFANFWVGEITDSQTKSIFDRNPKLILLLDGPDSPRALQVAQLMQRDPSLVVPVMHLSQCEPATWQDALGAVQGMQ